ncbi:LysM peptidoglycan-binding domain-containing protein [Altererythrobacter sp. Z27]|uniref:LysM peptidoglycan-binding domain-containing protein n=1 Tax=Altererythrobacter sp. Z27 TaxID=3461147 RepID=UPI0040439BD4
MVAIFSGLGAGFERGSASILGGAGRLGGALLGQGGDSVSVNVATGNLLISRQDEFLVGRGPDAQVLRTYNSLGDTSDRDNGDGWQQSTTRRVFGLTGTLNTAGSTIKRLSADGSVITYVWSTKNAVTAYWSTDGAGTYDRLVNSGSNWIWSDGDSKVTETYGVTVASGSEWRLLERQDIDGNKLTYSYVSDTDKLDKVTTANGEWLQYSWSGNDITKITTGYTDLTTSTATTLTRTWYDYSGGKLIRVRTDLSPEDNALPTLAQSYWLEYGYDGNGRVNLIRQKDGTEVAVTYDALGRVASITQTVSTDITRTTRIGYGLNVTSVTAPDGSITKLWYDTKGQLIQLMTPPATQGGAAIVKQFEYDADGNLIRTIETDAENASAPNNLVIAGTWADGEQALRGDNLVDDSGWPQDRDGTLPAAGSIQGSGFWLHAYAETEWAQTTGPYGQQVVSLHTGQTDGSDPGGGAYSANFTIDKSKAYEFSIYVKADQLDKHMAYFGLSADWGASNIVKNGWDGAVQNNPYFTAPYPSASSGWSADKWVKIVGYVLPDGTPAEANGSVGGVYDTETGNKLFGINHFAWNGAYASNDTHLRFFNYYNQERTGKFTHWVRPEVREVHEAAILRGSDKLDIARDAALFEAPSVDGWNPWSGSHWNYDEARWSAVDGPDGGQAVALQTGQFDSYEHGGGNYTNQFTVDTSKAYKFTQYVRKSDLSKHYMYFGLSANWGGAGYVKNAWDGSDNVNPYFMGWDPGTQQAHLQEDRWYKVVGYVMPEGSGNIAWGQYGGIFDTETGVKVGTTATFRWNGNRPDNSVYARFFTYYNETQHGWSTDWLAPEVVALDASQVAADSADPFGIVYDENGRITAYTYDARGNVTKVTDATGKTVEKWYDGNDRLIRERSYGVSETGSNVERWTHYAYDGEGHLAFIINPEGRVAEYRYAAAGQLEWESTYPKHAYTVSSTTPSFAQLNAWVDGMADRSDRQIVTYAYDARGNQTQMIDWGSATAAGEASTAEGNSHHYYTYDQEGQLLSRVTASLGTETFVYDGMGRLVSSVDTGGGTTSIVFDDANSKTIVTTAGSYVTTQTYNKAGELISSSGSGSWDVSGTASNQYDAMGRLRVATDERGLRTHYLYDKLGRQTGVISHDGHLVECRYDAAGRVVASTRFALGVSSINLATLQNPNNTLTIADLRPAAHIYDIWAWTVYDAAGRVAQVIDGTGGVVDYQFDAAGQLIKTLAYATKVDVSGFKSTSPASPVAVASHADDIITRTFYDRSGRAIGGLDGEGYLTEVVYDKAGQKVEEIAYAAKTSSSLWASGTFAQLRTSAGASNAANRRMHYVYDGQGLLRYQVDGAGRVSESVYWIGTQWHAVGLVRESIQYSAALSTSDFTYDNVKALVAGIANATNDRKTSFTYDSAGRVATSNDPVGLVTTYTYDTSGNVIRVQQGSGAEARITRNYYSAGGQLRFTVGGEGYVTRYDYDAEGHNTLQRRYDAPISVTDATTISQVNSLVGTGFVDQSFAYDNQDRLLAIFNGEGERQDYWYYGNGLLSEQHRDYNGSDHSSNLFDNDGAGRLLWSFYAWGETATQLNGAAGERTHTLHVYDAFGQTVRISDSQGRNTFYEYDKRGLLLQVTDAQGGVTTYEYNAFGERVKVTDARGNSSYSYYDNLGRVTKTRDVENYITETSYTAFGEVASVVRRYNASTSPYSITTQPTTTADPAKDAVTSFAYDKAGRVVTSTDAEGFVENYSYNVFGERTSKTARSETGNNADGANNTTTYAYDKLGRMVSETLPVGSYNNAGVLVASNVTNTYAYDARGNLITRVEASGLTEARTTSYVYDKADRLIQETGASFHGVTPVTTYAYDARGNLTRVTAPDGGKTIYYYDDLDRKAVEISPVGTYTAYEYDGNNNVTKIRVFGTAVGMPTDGGSQEEAPVAPAGEYRETRFEYDNLNRMTKSTVILQSGYKTGVLSGTSWTNVTTATLDTLYEYDANGNVVKTTDPEGNTTWAYYDRLGRKQYQMDAENYRTDWVYDAEGNVLSQRHYANKFATPTSTAWIPGGIVDDTIDRVTIYTYDRVGNRLTETRKNVVVHNGSGATSTIDATVSYTYNGLGQVTRKVEATGDQVSYTYDDAGRLTTESRQAFIDYTGASVTPTVDYYYNGVGNLTRTRQHGNANAAERVTTYHYDGDKLRSTTNAEGQDGNITDGLTTIYWYDVAGRVNYEHYVRYNSVGVATATYEGTVTHHDAVGRIYQQYHVIHDGTNWIQSGPVTYTAYNAYGDVIATQIGTGTSQTQYQYDLAGRLIKTNAGDGVWKHFGYDRNGNQTIAITSAGDNLTNITFAQALAVVGQTNVNATYTQYDKRNMAVRVSEEQRQLSTTFTQTLDTYRTYNAFDEVASETDAAGALLTYSYNTMGRMIRSEGPTVEITNEDGTSQWIKPSEDYYYDASGRLVAQRDANGSYATGGSSTNGTSKAANTGNLTRLALLAGSGYGGSEALITAETHADGGVKQRFYDIHGDARVIRDELGRDIGQAFDRLGRVIHVYHAGSGLSDYYSYDGLGRQLTHWNNLLGSSNKETTDYDIRGRVISSRAFGGDITTTSYTWDQTLEAVGTGLIDTGGWIQTTTMANYRTLSETTDIFGRAISKSDLGSNITSYTYDAAGRLSATSMGGLLTSFIWLNTELVGQQWTGSPNSGQTNTNWNRSIANYTYDVVGNRLTEQLNDESGTYVPAHWEGYENPYPPGTYDWEMWEEYYGGEGQWVEESYNVSSTALKNQSATFDRLGRLRTWTEAGTSTAPAASSTMQYDANGNVRRKSTSFYTLGSNGAPNPYQTGQDYWFRYDSMNRLVIDKGMLSGGTIGIAVTSSFSTGVPSQEFGYNAAGERAYAVSRVVTTSYPYTIYQEHKEHYVYDAAGRLTQIRKQSGATSIDPNNIPSASTGTLYTRSSFTYDLMGRQTQQVDYLANSTTVGYSRDSWYNAKGQMIEDYAVTLRSGDLWRSRTNYDYGVGSNYALGSVVQQASDNHKNSSDDDWNDTATKYFFAWYDGAVQSSIQYDRSYGWEDNTSGGGMTQGYVLSGFDVNHSTAFYYNGVGQLTSSHVNDGLPHWVTFKHDELGQVIRRDETRPSNAPSAQTGAPHEVWYRFGGREMGFTGNNGTNDISIDASIAERTAPSPTTIGTYRGDKTIGTTAYDFIGSSVALNSYSQGSAGGSYTVRGGETLQSIAANLYGDTQLWYKIAEANGLSGASGLIEGQQLRLPTGVQRTHFNASTFTPYDPAQATGDLSPTAPKPKKKNCGVFGQILLAAIAIAVSVMAPVGGTSFGAAIANAALGSIASQAVGVATGIQEKFSFKGVAMAALSAGVTAGIGDKFAPFGAVADGAERGVTAIANAAAKGALARAVTQGVAVATGLQGKFSFAGVAAAGVAAGVGDALGGAVASEKGFLGVKAGANSFGNQVAAGTASLIASAATRSAITGSSFSRNIAAGLPDVIGQVIGRALGGALRGNGGSSASAAGRGPASLSDWITQDTPFAIPTIDIDPIALPGVTIGQVAEHIAQDRSIPFGIGSSIDLSIVNALANGSISAPDGLDAWLHRHRGFSPLEQELTFATGSKRTVTVGASEALERAVTDFIVSRGSDAEKFTLGEVNAIISDYAANEAKLPSGRSWHISGGASTSTLVESVNRFGTVDIVHSYEEPVDPLDQLRAGFLLSDFGSAVGGAFIWDEQALSILRRENPYATALGEYGGLFTGLAGALKGTVRIGSKELIGDAAESVPANGWSVGDDIYNLTAKGNEPAWSTVRGRFWKNEAAHPQHGTWNAQQLERMEQGLAPQRYNFDKGGIESMDLSHEPIPFRNGGRDVVPRWPQDHAAIDPYRRPGY